MSYSPQPVETGRRRSVRQAQTAVYGAVSDLQLAALNPQLDKLHHQQAKGWARQQQQQQQHKQRQPQQQSPGARRLPHKIYVATAADPLNRQF
ncbi:hypothetical protein AWZ03_007583 [Drosophila navojoa]|uniref:Uncharacterized protein n=1 Tax=Drosophila navojoa TaxID=7232 RepID=A0A484BB00_DRONA|nr:hypothetical protein AWZ03_007583 [Drosophila navojoa]